MPLVSAECHTAMVTDWGHLPGRGLLLLSHRSDGEASSSEGQWAQCHPDTIHHHRIIGKFIRKAWWLWCQCYASFIKLLETSWNRASWADVKGPCLPHSWCFPTCFKYSWPLKNIGLNSPGPLKCKLFPIVNITTWHSPHWLNPWMLNHRYGGLPICYMWIFDCVESTP